MTAPPRELMLLAGLLLMNRLVIPSQVLVTPVYYAVQAMDVAAAVGVAWVGLPGLDEFPVVRWMIVILLAFHVAQNASVRYRKLHDVQMRAVEKERIAERAALRSAERATTPTPPEEA